MRNFWKVQPYENWVEKVQIRKKIKSIVKPNSKRFSPGLYADNNFNENEYEHIFV